jgi:hypothetical protein
LEQLTSGQPDPASGKACRRFLDVQAMIVCTSSVPRISRRSLTWRPCFQAPWNIVEKSDFIRFVSNGRMEAIRKRWIIWDMLDRAHKKLEMDQVIIVKASMWGTDLIF